MPPPELRAGLCAVLAALGASVLPQDPHPAPDEAPAESGGDASAETFALAFGWPTEGRAGVDAAVSRESGAATFAFDLEWKVEGERLRVRFESLRVLAVNGIEPEEPGFDVARATVAPALVPLVSFYVTREGEFDALVDGEAAAEDVLRAAESLGEDAGTALSAALADPAKRLALENRAAESWAWWGAFWIGYETRPGEAAQADVSLPSGLAGRPLSARLVQSCVDAHVAGERRAAHMRAETFFDGEDMLAVTLAKLRRTSNEEVPSDVLRSVSRVDQVDGIYLEDLRPIRVRWRKSIRIDDGREPNGRIEEQRWSFTWDDVDPAFPAQLDHDGE